MSRDLLFEIGVEELPATYVAPALEQLERLAHEGLHELRLGCVAITAYGTPRRLTLYVTGLADRQMDHDEEAHGPAVRVAYDTEGKPTRALLGFCQSKAVDPAQVRRVETPKGAYVAVTLHHKGQPALEVLPAWLASTARRLQFPKSMHWLPDPEVRFARPVRWIVALLGEELIPVRAFGLEAGRVTQGHRFLGQGPMTVPDAGRYRGLLVESHVLVDQKERRARMIEQIETLGRQVDGRVVPDPELAEINTFMVEWPGAFVGSFDVRYLDLPREVIVTALREHQRFFALENSQGRLLPNFVAVTQGARGLERVRQGNQDVLVARLEDARFYWETDLKHPPATRLEALSGVVWMEGLGTLRDKAARLESLGTWLAQCLNPGVAAHVARAALLCKTDLLSEMIGSGKEYASLEGVIGGHYARRAGEPDDVARAIAEHYRPRGAGDALPESETGALLALADKLDHVAGAFAAGKVPTGSEDPYGVRRAGNGVIRVLIEQGRHLDLYAATMESTRHFFAQNPELPHAAIMKQLGEFWRGRVEAAMEERGVPYDTREAALEARITIGPAGHQSGSGDAVTPARSRLRRPGWIDPYDCLVRARVLTDFRHDERFESLAILFKRVANILKAATETLPEVVDPARLSEPAERELLAALEEARGRTDPLWARCAHAEILPALLEMEQAIHAFFDRVLVNTEDLPTRVNRLRLLAEVRELFMRGWDLSKIVLSETTNAAAAPGPVPETTGAAGGKRRP